MITGAGRRQAHAYGDDPVLDGLWEDGEAGDGAACGDLYPNAPSGSEYPDLGDTCGGRTEGGGDCGLIPSPDTQTDGAGVDGGSDDEDVAIEEYAVAEIRRDLSAGLGAAGAGELSDAVALYAESRASDVELAAVEVAAPRRRQAQPAASTW